MAFNLNGDLDGLSASFGDVKITWYEKLDGEGDVPGPQRVITTQGRFAESTVAANLDGDAALNVIAAARNNAVRYEYDRGPMIPKPTPTDTTADTLMIRAPQQIPELMHSGPQLFGKKRQTAGLQDSFVAW